MSFYKQYGDMTEEDRCLAVTREDPEWPEGILHRLTMIRSLGNGFRHGEGVSEEEIVWQVSRISLKALYVFEDIDRILEEKRKTARNIISLIEYIEKMGVVKRTKSLRVQINNIKSLLQEPC